MTVKDFNHETKIKHNASFGLDVVLYLHLSERRKGDWIT